MRPGIEPPAADAGPGRRVADCLRQRAWRCRACGTGGLPAAARTADRAREIHQLALKAAHQQWPALRRPMAGGGPTRQLDVGPILNRQRVVQGLKVEHLTAQIPDVVAVDDGDAARQERRTGGLRSLAEILKVRAVADARDAGIDARVARQLQPVEQEQVAAIAAGIAAPFVLELPAVQAIAGKITGVDAAAVRGAQEAVLNTHVEAAVGVIRGREGGILIWSNVPVPRRGEHEPAAARSADFREQEPALARVVQRKRDPGQVRNRDATHIHDRAAADALAGGSVQAQFARTDLPGGALLRAAGVDDVAQRDDVARRHRYLIGAAVAGLLQQLELRVVEQRAVIAVAAGVTLHQHGWIVKAHPAADVEAVVVADRKSV